MKQHCDVRKERANVHSSTKHNNNFFFPFFTLLMSATTTTTRRRHHGLLKDWASTVVTPHRQQTVATVAIGSITLVAISSLFCLFFVVSLLDDIINVVSLGRLVTLTRLHWPGLVDKLSHQLTYFAEWEKQKRASWYSQDHPIYHEDRFHDLISAVTTYMNDYVHRKQQT